MSLAPVLTVQCQYQLLSVEQVSDVWQWFSRPYL